MGVPSAMNNAAGELIAHDDSGQPLMRLRPGQARLPPPAGHRLRGADRDLPAGARMASCLRPAAPSGASAAPPLPPRQLSLEASSAATGSQQVSHQYDERGRRERPGSAMHPSSLDELVGHLLVRSGMAVTCAQRPAPETRRDLYHGHAGDPQRSQQQRHYVPWAGWSTATCSRRQTTWTP